MSPTYSVIVPSSALTPNGGPFSVGPGVRVGCRSRGVQWFDNVLDREQLCANLADVHCVGDSVIEVRVAFDLPERELRRVFAGVRYISGVTSWLVSKGATPCDDHSGCRVVFVSCLAGDFVAADAEQAASDAARDAAEAERVQRVFDQIANDLDAKDGHSEPARPRRRSRGARGTV